ncbi:MAG TPA: CHAT domain-containing protein [Pyrinomonadaceae bacterium]
MSQFTKVFEGRATILTPLLLVLFLQFSSIPVESAGRGSFSYRVLQQNKVQTPPIDLPQLELGKSHVGKLSGSQHYVYRVLLDGGQYAKLIIKQFGVNVGTNVLGPDNKRIARVDSELRSIGEEKVELVAETSGSYRIRIDNKRDAGVTGSYEICLEELRPATLREQTIQQAQSLQLEAYDLYRPRVDLDRARLLAERALRLFESVEGPEGTGVAGALVTLAWIHNVRSHSQTAQELFERALAIREKVFGPDHVEVADSLSALGIFWMKGGFYTRAETLHKRALEIRERTLGRDHLEVAHSLNNLANLMTYVGNYAAAKPLYQRALNIREQLLDPDDLRIAKSLEELANVYSGEGNFGMAESLLQRAIHICEVKEGPEGPWTASAFIDLADIYMESGDYAKAKNLYKKALEIRQKKLDPNNHAIGFSLARLGSFNFKTGDYAQAESFYLRAIAIWEKVQFFGPNYPEIAAALTDLGQIYHRQRNYDKAAATLLRALDNVTRNSGDNHPHVALILNHLASVYSDQGLFEKAEPLFQRALQISRDANGQNHPSVARAFDNLAKLYLGRDNDRAVDFQSRASAIEDHNLALNLATGSERWKLSYLSALAKQTDRIVSLHLRFADKNPAARTLAASAIIQRKGRVLDAMSESLEALRRRFSVEDQRMLDQLNTTTASLARLTLNGPRGMNPDEHRLRIKDLEELKDKIEEEISQRSAGYYEALQPVTLDKIQAAIPPNAALIEFAVYQPFNPRAPEDGITYDNPQYVAYVIRSKGEVEVIEIGSANELDRTIDQWRQALRDLKRKDVHRLARLVGDKVMRPLRNLVGDVNHLLISPDGELNLMPFAALRDEQGRYLLERYAITYLTSGRDLLRMKISRVSKSGPVVLANPAFGDPQVAIAQAHATRAKEKSSFKRPNNEVAGNGLTVNFAPLLGTAEEARSIKEFFPEATFLTGPVATEASLKQVIAPRILHLATHGFFLDEKRDTTSRTAITNNDRVRTEHSLLRSGLALAGANLRRSGTEDGILTGLEATGMNLWGTKLVVLSACDTGVGEVRTGEGVYGLRRAFALAGAESLVMSLWPASDYTTRKLMTSYYNNLSQGTGRGEALRQVQLQMLSTNRQLHPFYWANFIQSGEWANLDGVR